MNDSTKYIDILQQALDVIEDSLLHVLSTASIAQEIGFSEYHFQRTFSAVVGESAASYVRKRRLSEASYRLQNSNATISDIAVSCQFGSQEAFTRVFKKTFGINPGQYRQSRIEQPLYLSKADLSIITKAQQGITLQPRIVEHPAEQAIGMPGSFSPRNVLKINTLWNRFLKRRQEIENIKDAYELGVCSLSHPLIAKDDGEMFVYVAALPVESIANIPEGMVPCELQAGEYAVFTHQGKLSDFQHTIDYIWGTWVPSQQYSLRDAPDFELYDSRFNTQNLDGEIDIYLPIK